MGKSQREATSLQSRDSLNSSPQIPDPERHVPNRQEAHRPSNIPHVVSATICTEWRCWHSAHRTNRLTSPSKRPLHILDNKNSQPYGCVMLAVVHDLAEAQVGDITPDEGFTKADKRRLEEVLL